MFKTKWQSHQWDKFWTHREEQEVERGINFSIGLGTTPLNDRIMKQLGG